jgi:hypothetical protein
VSHRRTARRGGEIKSPAFRPGLPSTQTAKRLKPAKASGAGIWQRITAEDTAFLPLVDPSDLFGSVVIVKPLGTTAFRFEKSGARRPESKTYCLSEVGGT